MNKEVRWNKNMKKTRVLKSRDTVPLNEKGPLDLISTHLRTARPKTFIAVFVIVDTFWGCFLVVLGLIIIEHQCVIISSPKNHQKTVPKCAKCDKIQL